MSKYKKYWDHWTVVYSSGVIRYFKSEEDARIECLNYSGISLRAPLYGDVDQ